MKTARKNAATQAEKTYDRIPLGVVRVDSSRRITYANPFMRALIGSDPVGENFLLFAAEKDRVHLEEELKKRFGGAASQYEIELHRPVDGRCLPVAISAAPEFDAAGKPVSSLGFVRDLSFERANDRIHRAIERETTMCGLFDALREEMAKLVPFDSFRVTLVSDDREHLASIYAHPALPVELTAVQWWPMPDVAKEYLKRTSVHDLDVDEWFNRPDVREQLRSDAGAQRWRETERIKHILVQPVLRDNSVTAFVALDSRSPQPYTTEQLRLCAQLPVPEVVLSALQIARRREIEFVMRLIRELGSAAHDLSMVARTLVDQIQSHYGWEHVSLFQVDADDHMLRLLTQAGSQKAKDGYAQPLDSGFLGLAYNGGAGRAINVGDVRAERHRNAYRCGITSTSSEMCLPVPGSRLRWILNMEASKLNAFAREDQERVEAVLREVGFALERSALVGLKHAITTSIRDAVIQTNDAGIIAEVNPAAGELLGAQASALVGHDIASFVDIENAHQAFGAASDFPRTETTLKRLDGTTIPALLSCARLPRELGGKVFVASDLSFQKRVEQTELLKDVFWQVAQETRTPLALVSSWLQRAAGAGKAEQAEILDKSRRQLRKMDLTLERVLRVASDMSGNPSSRSALDLGELVEGLVEEMPQADAERIDRAYDQKAPPVLASRQDLEFCVQNLFGVMMRAGALEEKLRVATRRQADSVLLELRSVAQTARRGGAQAQEAASSQTEIASGLDVVKTTLRRMGGELKPDGAGHAAFTISLPLAK